jgi:hypothetical protein
MDIPFDPGNARHASPEHLAGFIPAKVRKLGNSARSVFM